MSCSSLLSETVNIKEKPDQQHSHKKYVLICRASAHLDTLDVPHCVQKGMQAEKMTSI